MEIFNRLFKKPEVPVNHLSPQLLDLLFDWYNEAKCSIADFEKDFFEPYIEAIRKDARIEKYFSEHPEAAYSSNYSWLVFSYIISKYPDPAFIEKLLEKILDNQSVDYSTREGLIRRSNHHAIHHLPELQSAIILSTELLCIFHALHLRKDQNISIISTALYILKEARYTSDDYFKAINDAVERKSFKEHAYIYFSAYTDNKTDYRQRTIADSVKQLLEKSYLNSIETCNKVYGLHLNVDEFKKIAEFYLLPAYEKDPSTVTKKNITPSEELVAFVDSIKGKEKVFLETLVYFLSCQSMYEDSKGNYWAFVLKAVCKNFTPEKEWLKSLMEVSLENHESIIFKNCFTILLDNLKNNLVFNDPLVKRYQFLLYKRAKLKPYDDGLDILKFLAKKIEDGREQNFQLSKLGNYYTANRYFNWTALLSDEKDKKHPVEMSFIADLNKLLPIGLKKLPKPLHMESDRDFVFILNYKGEDLNIQRYYMAKEINELLDREKIPYRLCLIPITYSLNHYQKDVNYFSSLVFMSKQEYSYFKENHLQNIFAEMRENMVAEKIIDTVTNLQAMGVSDPADISFPGDAIYETALPFSEYAKQNTTTESLPGKSTENQFLNDINWNWFKAKYIDTLADKESWYGIMDVIIQTSGGKKPAKGWAETIGPKIIAMGTERYYKELQVLLGESFKEDFWYSDIYRNTLKGLIWSCTYIEPNETSLSIVRDIIERAYTKIAGVGAKSTAVGNLGLEALVQTGKEEAFGILTLLRNKTKYNKFVVALEKSIDKYKENSDVPEELLADRSIPKFGFISGEKNFFVENVRLVLSFEENKLVKNWYVDDKKVKSLPKDFSEQHARTLKEITEEVKQINKVFTDLKNRVKTYWTYNRSWKGGDWTNYIYNHPFINAHIRNLIWTNKTTQVDFIVLESGMQTLTNENYSPGAEDEIILWHPVINSEETINLWQEYIWKNAITQPERQAFRENYPFSEKELAEADTMRFAHHFLEVSKLMALANTAGWIFTYVHEGYSWPRVFLKPFNKTVHLHCDYDRNDYAIPTKELFFTEGNTTKNVDRQTLQLKITLSSLPDVTRSEICRDIDLFIAVTSVSNNPELSSNRQGMDNYRTDYKKGLFSDNATAVIRKKIIRKLVPVLGIKSEGFEGNFLLVNGKSTSYKINLGSGFAQVRDTQKHINIIPSLSAIKKNKKLRLPIEDDDTLYIILAKALYLQEDNALELAD